MKKEIVTAMSVAEIKKLPPNTVVRLFKGTVKSVEKRIPNKPDEVPPLGQNVVAYSFESIMVTDKDGDDIRITFGNRLPLPDNLIGKAITLIAHDGKSGWSGVYSIENSYKAKSKKVLVTREIKVTPTGEVVFNGQVSHPKDNDADASDSSQQDDIALPAKSNGTHPKTEPANTLNRTRQFMAQRANAWVIAHDAAVYAVTQAQERHADAPMSPATITAMTLALYNSGCFVNGLYDGLPVAKLPVKKQEAAANE